MGCGGHHQEMPGSGREQLTQLKSFGLVDRIAEVIGRHLMGFVHDDQIPLCNGQLFLELFTPGQLIQPGNEFVLIVKRIAGMGMLQKLPGEDGKDQSELLIEFILPLLHQAARTDNQNPLGISPHHQFANEQAGHDGLPGPRIVGQDIAQGLFLNHGLIHSRDLVGQRLHI